MNKIFLLGNLTKDVETRYTTNNLCIATFNIAVRREQKNKEGNYDSDFINCVAYGKLGETIGKYFKKGSRIVVDGELRNNNYEKDGVKHYSDNVVVNSISFVDKPEKKEEKIDTEIVQQAMNDDPYKAMGEEVQAGFELPF
jgi:single-strand DNA-binding protein